MRELIDKNTRLLLHFPPNHWHNYGQAVHPHQWWQGAVNSYFKRINPSFKEGDILIKERTEHHLILVQRITSRSFTLKKSDIVRTLYFILN